MDNDDDSHSHSHSQKNHTKKHNFGINISKGGGGISIGVGIVLVGAAFLLNFFLNKPPKKPTNTSTAENHKISAENTFHGTEKEIGSGVSKEISAHKVFEDGDHTFEGSNDGLTCDNDDEEMTREEADVKLVSCIEVKGDSIDHDDEEKDSAKHGEEDDLLNLESIEDNNTDATCEEKGTADQYDGLIHQLQIVDGAGGEFLHLQHSSNGDAPVLDENELLEEPKTGDENENEAEFEVQTNAETEGQLDVHTNSVGEAAETDSSIEYMSNVIQYRVIKEAIEDKEIQHDVHTNAVQEAFEMDSSIEHTTESVGCQVIKEAIEAQHHVHINAVREAGEIDSSNEPTTKLAECQVIEEVIDIHINAAGEAVEINSGSKKASESIEIQTIPHQDHSHVSHQITTDNILPQAESSTLQELNPTTGLKIGSKDVGIDLHSIEPVTEKDIIYQETDESLQEHQANPIPGENNEDGSQTLTADNVDEILEESFVQAKDQTDKLQENKEHATLQKTEKEIHYKEIEDDDAISSVNIEKGVSNMNFLMRLTQQKNDDEKTSLLMIKRGPIVIGTMSALLWPVCYSCLIAVLAMVIYKIQGF